MFSDSDTRCSGLGLVTRAGRLLILRHNTVESRRATYLRSPVRHEVSMCNGIHLGHQRHRELSIVLDLSLHGGVPTPFDHRLDLFCANLLLRAVVPKVAPIRPTIYTRSAVALKASRQVSGWPWIPRTYNRDCQRR